MREPITFGTDGWRGVIAEDFTFDNVRRAAHAFARYLQETGRAERGVVVGYDHRFHSENFATAVAEVMAAHGIHVYLTAGPMPTPVISHTILDVGAGGGVNITASHNPPTDNGFKIRADYGGAVASEELPNVEKHIPPAGESPPRLALEEAVERGLVEYVDPTATYTERVIRLVDLDALRSFRVKLVADPMWGVGSNWFPRLIGGDAVEIVQIHAERNPIFPEMIRPEPIPPNVDVLRERVPSLGADVGIATDGDADRVGIVAETGRFVNQLEVFSLLAYYLLEVRGWRGPIVKTLSASSMLEKLGARYGVPVHETGVGFKYVAPKMLETDAIIGGEESGGYAFRGHLPERDGILAGLMFLDLMYRTGKRPTELLETLFGLVGPHYYERWDVRYPAERREEIRANVANARPSQIAGFSVERIDTTDGWKFHLGDDGGWLLIRFSGTEPLIRVYTETTREEKVEALLRAGLAIAGVER
ncbi:MAG: phosphoglucomutase/phosphomannomutase family protein [Ardenticatenia bacterium]|nr:phosphoglucomutase/phosphomannomutase family protein [Ardenticatenia bacterium]